MLKLSCVILLTILFNTASAFNRLTLHKHDEIYKSTSGKALTIRCYLREIPQSPGFVELIKRVDVEKNVRFVETKVKLPMSQKSIEDIKATIKSVWGKGTIRPGTNRIDHVHAAEYYILQDDGNDRNGNPKFKGNTHLVTFARRSGGSEQMLRPIRNRGEVVNHNAAFLVEILATHCTYSR